MDGALQTRGEDLVIMELGRWDRENSFWLAYFPLRGERLFKKTDVHRRLKAFAFDASLARMLLEQAESQTAQ